MFFLTLGLVSLFVWVDLLVARGRFWRTGALFESAPAAEDLQVWPSVVAIVPARNEAEVLPDTLPTFLRQNYPGELALRLVDDQSADDTAHLARAIIGSGRNASVVEGAPPPAGWTGKLWAMQQGVASTAGSDGPDYLLFVDADIALAANVLRQLVALAEARGAVLVSLMAKLRCESAAEQWLVPAFIFFFRMLYPFSWASDPRRRTAAAAGGCMLVSRRALEEAGGLAALKGALIDDCALAALLKRRGPIWLGLTEQALSLRAYPRFDDFARMVMRSAFAELRYSALRLAFVIAAMGVVFVAPPLLAVFSRGLPQACGAASWAIMAIAFAPTLRFYRQPTLGALALPLIALVYTGFTAASAVEYWSGRGGQWKGRVQAPTPQERRA